MKLTDLQESNIMLEMANLTPSNTGVGYVMYFGEVGGQHGPRIKVSNKKGRFARESNFVVSVSQTPEVLSPETSVDIPQSELNKVFEWVKINYADLMLLWQILQTGDNILLPDGNKLNIGTILNRLKKV
ncbi:MAG: hypothetical protein ACREAU_02835 [Nitrosopumilaceae archaeon]